MPYKDINKQKSKEKEWRINHPFYQKEKYKIREISQRLYKKTKPCELCGEKKSERHHLDYSNPRLIKWLCRKCHRNIHKKYILCKIKDCKKIHHSKGFCKLHYNRWRRLDPIYYQEDLKRNRAYKKRLTVR